jgi:acetolactate synthase-1/2/3 large subunit
MKRKPDVDEWWKQIQIWQEECPLEYKNGNGKLRAGYVFERISEKTKGNAIIITDVGQQQMWAAQLIDFHHPRSHISSGGLGTMGFSVPASIGAAFGVKDRPIISISGDGGFQMNIQELITAVSYNLPIKFVVINNSFLGMVRQWQELFHAEKYSFTDLSECNPDFVKIAEAMGLTAFRAESPNDVDEVIDKMMSINDKPVFAEFKVFKEDMVFPMVPSGASISDMMLERLNPKRMM